MEFIKHYQMKLNFIMHNYGKEFYNKTQKLFLKLHNNLEQIKNLNFLLQWSLQSHMKNLWIQKKKTQKKD